MSWFFWLLISFIGLGVILIYAVTTDAHNKHTREYDTLLQKHIFSDPNDKDKIDRAIKRAVSYITTYHLYQSVDKATSILALTFSVGSILLNSMESGAVTSSVYGQVTSFFSLIFVILALYLSPKRRIRQYKHAWLELDRQLEIYFSGSNMAVKDVLTAISKCEESLDCDDE